MSSPIVVIGAGVIGCAVAEHLSRTHQVIVFEKLSGPGLETSRLNSGVIHSGIHLPPTSTKAKMARIGSQLVRQHCQRYNVPFRRVGMYILVSPRDVLGLWPETSRLFHMLARAKEQGIEVDLMTPWAIRQQQPSLHCLFGLRIPDVGIIDASAFVASLHQQAELLGATFFFNQPVVSLSRRGTDWVVRTPDQEILAAAVINVAGLYADRVAGLAGYSYRQYFYRGEYYEVDQAASGISVSSLAYPVHQPGKPGLGVHITPTVDGRLLLGPNAVAVERRDMYRDRPTPAEHFAADVRPFLPELRPEHLTWAYSGIRPKLTNERAENDFCVVAEAETPLIINGIGLESPGLTAAMALAQHIGRLLATRLK